ncbi:BMP family lipoprotein [Cohnella luojiensis]|uniref:BMP family ABC transporter substrate-binding protein n=1 Tax=Cohnella luojiensis TaxID=652876 RepID=A0A4Y8M9M2_9BACL|nr:BMP family protein [Cohnella luojiensis]TFE29984.1 BMP family ABC transporter substrate-binding protein [Cohnella luojiensis]
MKKPLLLVLTFVLLGGLLAACGSNNGNNAKSSAPAGTESASASASPSESAAKPKKIALVTPEPIGVNPFFQLMDEGFKKAGEEFGVEVKTIESTDPASIEQNLRTAAAGDYDLIITSTFQVEDALKKIAPEFPDKSFAVIDTVIDLPNVRSVAFREHEASYLLGAAAALISKSGTVGNVVALDIPLLSKYTSGFDQGAKSVNPDIKVLVNYVGGFTDPAKAKELAILQNSQGADFIAGMSAVGDLGVFEAAGEKGFFASGQDTDNTDGKQVILSQLKGTDAVAYETVKDFVSGNFSFGVRDYGLKEGGVGLTFVNKESKSPLNDAIGQENIDKLKKINDDIVAGTIVVKNPLQ